MSTLLLLKALNKGFVRLACSTAQHTGGRWCQECSAQAVLRPVRRQCAFHNTSKCAWPLPLHQGNWSKAGASAQICRTHHAHHQPSCTSSCLPCCCFALALPLGCFDALDCLAHSQLLEQHVVVPVFPWQEAHVTCNMQHSTALVSTGLPKPCMLPTVCTSAAPPGTLGRMVCWPSGKCPLHNIQR
jgi:hypothetical protein